MQELCFRQNSIAPTEKGSMCTVLVHKKEVTKATGLFVLSPGGGDLECVRNLKHSA